MLNPKKILQTEMLAISAFAMSIERVVFIKNLPVEIQMLIAWKPEMDLTCGYSGCVKTCAQK